MKFIKIIVLIYMLFPVVSCKKFLAERSQSEVIPKTAQALNELLLGEGYGFVPHGSLLQDDDIENISAIPLGNRNAFFEYTWQPPDVQGYAGMPDVSGWVAWYKIIQICNTVLDYLPRVLGTDEEKEYVKGQALLLRTYSYFNLVNLYALPYTDKLTSAQTNPGVPLLTESGVSLEPVARASVAEVYNQMVLDVTEGTLALEKVNKKDPAGRISHVAGYLLASRIYLHMGEWQKCIEAATRVLNYNNSLMDLPNWGAPDLNSKPIIGGSNSETIWEFGKPGAFYFGSDYDEYAVSQELISNYETGDLRRSIYINGVKPNKLPYPRFIFQPLPSVAFRVSEAYLNRAEAYAQLFINGDGSALTNSLDDLNTLRKARFTADTYQPLNTSDATELLEWCRREKRLEFFREEFHRWFDLKRFGMPAITHKYVRSSTTEVYVLEERDPAYMLQIPASAINKNVKLVQNPKLPGARIAK